MGMGLGRLQELVMDREAWGAAIHGVAKSWTQLSDWTELKDKETRAVVNYGNSQGLKLKMLSGKNPNQTGLGPKGICNRKVWDREVGWEASS